MVWKWGWSESRGSDLIHVLCVAPVFSLHPPGPVPPGQQEQQQQQQRQQRRQNSVHSTGAPTKWPTWQAFHNHTPPSNRLIPPLAALRAAQQSVQPSAAGGKLLFWPLDGPTLETSGLAVMAGPTNPDVRAPYYNAATGVWHPVSQLPISKPRVSSITVRVTELED